jgi:hypothetical protein
MSTETQAAGSLSARIVSADGAQITITCRSLCQLRSYLTLIAGLDDDWWFYDDYAPQIAQVAPQRSEQR